MAKPGFSRSLAVNLASDLLTQLLESAAYAKPCR